ncbi:hypothetical protein Fcan01_16669 [Folsomia candida]|uniref:Uncharacterized protein n=1 Tax=Folsomia candida TaxID=158441 RepID=A0A226DTM4_FOLCA|nr:hypothetical protein Fcan01_16669 [Folsomia candida]
MNLYLAILFHLIVSVHGHLAHSGNFIGWGYCTLKFYRTDSALHYRDLNEALIHVNNEAREQNLPPLVYTVTEGLTSLEYYGIIQDYTFSLDYHFFEKCSITIAFNIKTWQQWHQIRYIYSQDNHRTDKFQNFVVINESFETDIYINHDAIYPGKLYLAVVQHFDEVSVQLEFYFYCVYCRDFRILRLHKKYDPSSLTASSFRPLFRKFEISVFMSMIWSNYESCKGLGGLVKLYYCEEALNTVEYLSYATNFTTNLETSMTTATFNPFGYIILRFYETRWYSATNHLKFAYSLGHSIFYCNFDKIGENTDLAMWLTPLQGRTWLVLIIFLVWCFVVFGVFRQRNNPLYRNTWNLLGYFALMFKAPATSPLALNSMLIVLLQLLAAHYEYFFTSRLIVPPHFKELSTLKEFMDKGYILHYDNPSKGDSSVLPWEDFVLEDFRIQGVPSEMFSKSFIPVNNGVGANSIAKYIFPGVQHKRNAFYSSVDYQEIKLLIVESIYNNVYQCYIAKNVGLVRPVYFEIYTVLGEKFFSALQNLEEFGIYNVWTKWYLQTQKYRVLSESNNTGVRGQDIITFNNLSRFVLLYYSVLAGFLCIFVVDRIFSANQEIFSKLCKNAKVGINLCFGNFDLVTNY